MAAPGGAPLAARVVARGGDRRAPPMPAVPLRTVAVGLALPDAEAEGDGEYWYIVNGRRLPDPCTRHQPRGLRGPSRVVDPGRWTWTDAGFRPPPLEQLVLYELHIGSFSRAGTFAGAIEHLPRLVELGIGAIELMPVAEFPGLRGWGYDGVYPWSAHHAYGGPDGLAQLVDRAHALGMAVILDVVYNHVGASGEKALRAFGPYFTDRYGTFWGEALNYDGEDSGAVREWVLQGAEHLVRDFHIDGLRLDAVHAIFDASAEPLLRVLGERVHAARPGALVIAESALNDPKVLRADGWALDAQWADDFHHCVRTLVTSEREGYYAEFGKVAQLAKAWRTPFVHDGDYSSFRRRRHGAPVGELAPQRFVVFTQNHDQVGNRALGDRLPRAAQPLAAFCVLLSPYLPMLWMGEEYGERAPFQFFTDHIDKRIARATREGRRREFAAFSTFSGEEVPDPQDPATFERSKLTRRVDRPIAELYAELLRLRRELPPGQAEVLAWDERERWLLVRRGRFELAMCFARRGRRRIPVSGRRIVLSTGGAASLRDDALEIGAMTGVLIS
ncbi:MAG: malto-oligosyltrehalose trehalohydrolase [Solirubrobacteraceae bacterium]